MEPYLTAIICILVIAVIAAFVVLIKKSSAGGRGGGLDVLSVGGNALSVSGQHEMTISFEDLPALTEQEETQLVEIKDSKLLARIDNVIPGTLQTVATTEAVHTYQEAAKSTDQLYQAIIPKGAVLDKSKEIENAVRGSYRETGTRIKGNANWVPVDNKQANRLANVSKVNAAMNVASMVVGQYYMSQISDQLEEVSAKMERIATFQQNEFKSKVYLLVAEVQKSSTFQVETIENNELRNRELIHLDSLEQECAQLLGQANLSLQDVSGKRELDYDAYEKAIGEAEIWFQYQQILLEVMYKLSELVYVLNVGAMSREHSFALYQPYAKQSEGTLAKLKEWHDEHVDRLKISVEDSRRKRQGIDAFFAGIFGLFDDKYNYIKMSQGTIERIEHQTNSVSSVKLVEADDLYQEDVRLIAKDGKLFYLPNRESVDYQN